MPEMKRPAAPPEAKVTRQRWSSKRKLCAMNPSDTKVAKINCAVGPIHSRLIAVDTKKIADRTTKEIPPTRNKNSGPTSKRGELILTP